MDWIQGEKFVKIADWVYTPAITASDDYAKYPNTFNPSNLKDTNFVYTCTMYLGKLLRILKYLPQKFVIICHNGDQHLEDGVIGTYNGGRKIAEEPYVLTNNIIKLYIVNPDVRHRKVDLIPLGMENTMWKRSLEKRELIPQLIKQNLPRTGLVYMNHNPNTNPGERRLVWEMFKDTPWVTVGQYDPKSIKGYYMGMATHKFVLNPQGNCFDNHRMWEAWHLGCIPISKRSITIDYFRDYPHIIIDDWRQVTQDFLESEYKRISAMDFDRNKLTFEYWKNKVLTLI